MVSEKIMGAQLDLSRKMQSEFEVPPLSPNKCRHCTRRDRTNQLHQISPGTASASHQPQEEKTRYPGGLVFAKQKRWPELPIRLTRAKAQS